MYCYHFKYKLCILSEEPAYINQFLKMIICHFGFMTILVEMDFPDFYFIIKPIVKQELVMKIMAMYAYENTKYVYGHALLSK